MNALKLLSKETLESLRRVKIRSLGQVAILSAEELLEIPGIDKAALAELERALASLSIKLNANRTPDRRKAKWIPPPEYSDTGTLAKSIRDVFEHDSRIRNVMIAARIRTLGQLVRQQEADLLLLPNFGRTSLAILKDVLVGLKLTLAMTDEQIQSPTLGECSPPSLIQGRNDHDDSAVSAIPVEEISGLSNRTINCLTAAGIRTVGQLKSTHDKRLLMLRGFGAACLNEIRLGLKKLAADVESGKARTLLTPVVSGEDRPYVPLELSIEALFENDRRIGRAILSSGITTLEQLIRIPAHAVVDIPDIGRGALAVVREHLIPWALHPGMSESEIAEIRRWNMMNAGLSTTIANAHGTTANGKPLLSSPIDLLGESDFPLSLKIVEAFDEDTRVKNSLREAEVNTIEELVRRTAVNLLSFPHFGRTSLKIIEAKLTGWHLRLGMTYRDVDAFRQIRKSSSSGPSAIREPYNGGSIVEVIRALMAELSSRDRQLLQFHFHAGQSPTLEQTGRQFKLTRERVRQLIRRSGGRLFARLQRAGLGKAAKEVRNLGGFYQPGRTLIHFLNVPEKKIRPVARLINGIAVAGRHEDAIFFDSEYLVWHLGDDAIIERLRHLKRSLRALTSLDDVTAAVASTLNLPPSELSLAQSIAEVYCTRELVQMPGSNFWWQRRAPKQEVVEGILLHLFPDGAHFSEIADATKNLPGKWHLISRNVHAQLALNPNVVLWGRGSFRHKNAVKVREPLMAQLLSKIEELFLPEVSTVSAHAVFDRYKSLAVQAGLPNPYALYGCLEWQYPKSYLYRHFPDIESLRATRQPRIRRVAELEAVLADSDRPLSVDEIIQRMGSHRRLQHHQINQRLPESRCVLLYDAGCYVHESVLGISAQMKADIQSSTRSFLRSGVGYATTKEIRLSIGLPPLKLPWTLRLLGSILEQDPAVTRIYNVVALGCFDRWERLLEQIIRDAIGSRPGITIDDLNDYLIGHEFITLPLAPEAFARFEGLSISDGYVRSNA